MTQTGELDLYRWVEASHLEYGSDPWCFIRELAQNSRDADATRIEVTCGSLDNDEEWITFHDDGKGMAWANARAFLLKLYASSKDETEDYAGTFGVGFWTVLLFKPKLILISSCADEERWGLKIDQRLRITRQESELENRGTSITLIRDRQFTSASAYRDIIMERTVHYCRFLTRRLSEQPLQTFCAGQRISSELTLGYPHELFFKSKNLRGVVALASQPRVELLVKGIPVWQGCSLDELRQIQGTSSPDTTSMSDFDQAPAFLLDARRLKVSFTRREVIHDQELKVIMKEAHKALSLHLEMQAKAAFPPPVKQIVRRWFSRHSARVLTTLLLLLILIPLLLFTLNRLPNITHFRPAESTVQTVNPSIYQGSLNIGATAPAEYPAQISYSPPEDLLLRWFVAGRFDPLKGWHYISGQPPHPYNELKAPISGPVTTFTLKNIRTRELPLLLPAKSENYRLVSASPKPFFPVARINGDLLVLLVPPEIETVIYQSFAHEQDTLSDSDRSFWLQCPSLDSWPESWQKMISQGRKATALDRLHLVHKLMKANFHYLEGQYPASSALHNGNSWLDQVLESGSGDCDILNGFAVLLLRSLDIPSRLVIGWQGQKGIVASDLHAWCEAWINGIWMVVDYSALVPQLSLESTSTPHSTSPLTPFIIPFSLILTGSLFLLFLLLLMKTRFVNATRIKGQSTEKEEAPAVIRSRLIQSARSAVLRPRLWGPHNAIWDLRLIPSFPDPISLRESIAAFNQGRLITVTDPETPPEPLLSPLTKNRFIRFNGGETDAICQLLPKNIDLADLPWHSLNMPQSPVISELNTLLKKDLFGRWKIVEVDRHFRTAPLKWFDLRAIRGAKRAYGSDHLILISSESHPPFLSAFHAWEWICRHHNGISPHTLRHMTRKLLRNPNE